MRICSLSSGSKGNLIYVESEKSKVIIDCGLTGKLAESLIRSIGVDPGDLNGIFVTHEHTDHIKGVGIMSRRFDIPVIANERTWLAMKNSIGKIDPKNIFVFKTNTYFSFRDLDIHAMSTFHDAADPVFYMFYEKDQKATVITDTGTINDLMLDAIKDSSYYLFESNHDIEMLRLGPYSPSLKRRILSDHGHLSNVLAKESIAKIVKGRGEHVVLGHLSDENNTDKIAFKESYEKLSGMGLDVGKDVKLRVASKFKADIVTDLGDL